MADGDSLPLGDRVLRYCFQDRFVSGNISAANFAPRVNRDKGRLSTIWVECIHLAHDERTTTSAANQLRRQIKSRHSQDRIACLEVSAIVATNSSYGPAQVLEDWGDKLNKRHAALIGLAANHNHTLIDFLACAKLAELARLNSIPAD